MNSRPTSQTASFWHMMSFIVYLLQLFCFNGPETFIVVFFFSLYLRMCVCVVSVSVSRECPLATNLIARALDRPKPDTRESLWTEWTRERAIRARLITILLPWPLLKAGMTFYGDTSDAERQTTSQLTGHLMAKTVSENSILMDLYRPTCYI